MADLFDDNVPEPEAFTTYFKNSEHEGELLYILPKRKGMTEPGKYDAKPMVVCEVRILDGAGKGFHESDVELKGQSVVSQLTQRLQDSPGKAFIARLGKDGQAHVLKKPTEADKEFANKALSGDDDKPPF